MLVKTQNTNQNETTYIKIDILHLNPDSIIIDNKILFQIRQVDFTNKTALKRSRKTNNNRNLFSSLSIAILLIKYTKEKKKRHTFMNERKQTTNTRM